MLDVWRSPRLLTRTFSSGNPLPIAVATAKVPLLLLQLLLLLLPPPPPDCLCQVAVAEGDNVSAPSLTPLPQAKDSRSFTRMRTRCGGWDLRSCPLPSRQARCLPLETRLLPLLLLLMR